MQDRVPSTSTKSPPAAAGAFPQRVRAAFLEENPQRKIFVAWAAGGGVLFLGIVVVALLMMSHGMGPKRVHPLEKNAEVSRLEQKIAELERKLADASQRPARDAAESKKPPAANPVAAGSKGRVAANTADGQTASPPDALHALLGQFGFGGTAGAGDDKRADLEDLIAKVEPSVVRVNTKGLSINSVGSGFVADKGGLVVTNLHVVDEARHCGNCISRRRQDTRLGLFTRLPGKGPGDSAHRLPCQETPPLVAGGKEAAHG